MEERIYKKDNRIFKNKSISKSNLPYSGYCIFRVGKSFKNFNQIKGFQRHMEREINVVNANKNISNSLLIGTPNIETDVKNYIEGCWKRKDSVIAKELLLTASPQFFKNINIDDLYKWIDINIDWLKSEFGSNLIYANIHFDETSPHINALIVPKFKNNKGYLLSNKRYFGGSIALRKFQDRYYEAISKEFPVLKRGIKYSKAKHIEIRHFYGIINKNITPQELKDVSKHNTLLENNLKKIQATLSAYKHFSDKIYKENENFKNENHELIKKIEFLKKDKEQYKEVIKAMSYLYDLPQNAIRKTFNYVKEKIKER